MADRWIPARRFKRPDEYTLWETLAFWRDIPLVSQETADAEHRANPRMTAWTLAPLPSTVPSETQK
jgi:hypothetical protein